MAVKFRKRNIAILFFVFLSILLVFAWVQSDHKTWHLLSANTMSSSTLKSPRTNGGPALPEPVLQSNASALKISRSYTLDGMQTQCEELNFEQVIRNTEKFGNHRTEDPIIVIQSHDRHEFLLLLLESLRKVTDIESATLVISRDKFTPDMDKVIDKHVTFCRYLEIFFPFSMQLFPNKFPGEDPNDCPRDLSKLEAKSRGCNNAEFPDMYGHYREVKFVQLKHHWFWKLNMVFEGVREFHEQTGPILMLEDDNYVTPDLIDVMRKAVNVRDSRCSDCLSITLGAYDSTTDYQTLGDIVDIKTWVSTKYNIGMVLNRKFYDMLSNCAKYFCDFDDYNWDWTLQSTALRCFDHPLYTMVLRVPRVYHLGCTGFHQKNGGKCNVDDEVGKLVNILESQAKGLFPHELRVQSEAKSPNPAHTANGGWGDLRDRELCKKYRDLCKVYLKDK